MAERKSLASSTSMSCALDDVEHELLRPKVAWLLTEAAGVDPVLQHPAVRHYDALGQGWHVLDYDPTSTVLRQRALPTGGDLPEPRRRAEGFAEPGYPGRSIASATRCQTEPRWTSPSLEVGAWWVPRMTVFANSGRASSASS